MTHERGEGSKRKEKKLVEVNCIKNKNKKKIQTFLAKQQHRATKRNIIHKTNEQQAENPDFPNYL